jgi:3,5-epimerase/4-reductase
MGTGCIFTYDTTKVNGFGMQASLAHGFTEESNPNFFGSSYSVVKGYTDMLMRHTNALVLRIRMPITSDYSPRNFITKILKYQKVCSLPNSMSVLDELIPLSIEMMTNNEIGCYNFTNPGYIDHNSILTLYRYYVDKDFKWDNFTIEEQRTVLKADRSNNVLETSKLEKKYKIKSIEDAMETVFTNMSKLGKLNL